MTDEERATLMRKRPLPPIKEEEKEQKEQKEQESVLFRLNVFDCYTQRKT